MFFSSDYPGVDELPFPDDDILVPYSDYVDRTVTGIAALLEDYLGEPISWVQENMLMFFSFFALLFIISFIFDIITNITRL